MALYIISIGFIFSFIISSSWCKHTQQIIITEDQSFSFDCQFGESVYFGQRLGDWSEIKENDQRYINFNLKFLHLRDENILRIKSDSARAESVGFYGCRQSTQKTMTMTRIYHLIIAEVQSFYWTYICHAPPGACVRSDDSSDDTLSTFEVAEKTSVHLYCCASATGYKQMNINMNRVGTKSSPIEIKEKQELDGSWVVCANQHTEFQRTSSNEQQTFRCELIVDDLPYASLTSVIKVKDAVLGDPSGGHIIPTKPNSNDNDYFNRKPSNAGRSGTLASRKQIIIITGFIIGSFTLFGLLFCLILFLCYKKKALKKSTNKTNKSHTVNRQNSTEEEESAYMEPTPLYVNFPGFPRV